MSVKGRIHSFESFGTLDGPGIRFVVFMQGCPLRCLYCHNRDTWDIKGGEEYSTEEVITHLKKYVDYIRFSGGGITVTGGEPTLQPEFVTELFKNAKEMNIHTALDTSGYADLEKVSELLSYTDLVLLDIKHAEDEGHRKVTGAGIEKTKKFARYLSDKGIPIWIRYVLVPGFTDDRDDLIKVSKFIKELNTVEKIEILPYHKMGAYKWEKLGKKYELEGVREPLPEEINTAKQILEGL